MLPCILILTGGFGTRMGEDKGLCMYSEKPFIAHIIEKANLLGLPYRVSLRKDQASFYSNWVPKDLMVFDDIRHPEGPCRGILSAFEAYPDFEWIVVPVDMPHIPLKALSMLLEGEGSLCFNLEGVLQPFPLRLSTADLKKWSDSPRNDSVIQTINWLNLPTLAGQQAWMENWNRPSDIH